MSLAPSLYPYAKHENFDVEQVESVEASLYNFLSPELYSVETSMTSQAAPSASLKIPKWYQDGANLGALLKKAESLNWSSDCGERLSGNLTTTNTMRADMAEAVKYINSYLYVSNQMFSTLFFI